jgi:hypothetical protein
VPWIASMLVTPDSWSSRVLFGGKTLTSFSNTDIAGMLNLSYNFGLHVAVYSEMLLSVCLNLDVVSTIRYPFSRNENLKYIMLFMQFGFLLIGLNSILAVASVLETSESTEYVLQEPSEYEEYLKTGSVYYAMKKYYNNYYIWVSIFYVLISLYSLIVVAWAFGSVVR